MAGSRKKSATANETPMKPKQASKKQGRPKQDRYEVRQFGDTILDEIILILVIVVGILVVISLFSSGMGVIGELLRGLVNGLLGLGGYFLPFVAIVYCIWMLMAKDHEGARLKLAGGILFILSISALSAGIGAQAMSGNFFVKCGKMYAEGSAANGGVLGGIVDMALGGAIGSGKYLVLVAVALISLIMSTGKSFVTGISEIFQLVEERQREREEKIKSEAEIIRMRETAREKKRTQMHKNERRSTPTAKRMKKGDFNIKIGEDEGLQQEGMEDKPVIEVPVFKAPPQELKQDEKIYDFVEETEKIPILPVIKSNENPKENPIIHSAVQELLKKNKKQEEIYPVFMNPESVEEKLIVEETGLMEELDEAESEESSWEEPEGSAKVSEAYVNSKIEEDSPAEKVIEHDWLDSDEEDESPEEILAKLKAEKQKICEQELESKRTVAQGKKQTSQLPVDNKEVVEVQRPHQVIREEKEYEFPPINLLGKRDSSEVTDSREELLANARKLEETLHSFGVQAKVVQINKGPTVTSYEVSPNQGVKVSKIVNLSDDIALNLAASGIRIEAPIPGKAAVGIEVPNVDPQSVYLRDVLESETYQKFPSKVAFAVGEDITGQAVVTDIAKMPHLLIAGATGSGKSVCINTLITSILYKAKPEEVKLLLVDPKVVELSVYNGIPHLLIPVVTDPKKAAGALNWAVREMLSRYEQFSQCGVRNIKGYNALMKEEGNSARMPQIVIVIDELADLMMAAPGEVEDSICRLAQLARAAGMHLIIATQRPSVDVITGVIKANIPSRMAFAVSSGIDSRTILDCTGAEKLIGKGDMLFSPMGSNKPMRIQGAFVTDQEVEAIVEFIKKQKVSEYDKELIENITSATGKNTGFDEDSDEFLNPAIELVVKKEKASVSMLQRQFRIGYNRAARLMDDLERRGIVGPEEGSKPRKVLLTQAELEGLDEENDDAEDQG